ncbi:MAG TPA: M50 family metallopeptidase [Tepidisphaeraceae bacterium]|jgi:Zn-dependent protease
MGWQDREYNRGYRGGGGIMMWLVTGRVPLFTLFGIRVQLHASMVITLALGLLLGFGPGFGWRDRLESTAALFLIVLLHEFGHCFAARWVGGEADEIVMHPLGGLALCSPPHRPLPTFLTVAGGPAVNVLICVVCGVILLATTGGLPWNPFRYAPVYGPDGFTTLGTVAIYSQWIYQMSFSLLVFNLLPIYPLDGGQMVQAALWPRIGFYKSMKLSCEVGMFASVAAAAFALSTGQIGLTILAGLGFYTCFVMRQQLMANGPEGFEAVSYAVGPDPGFKKPKQSWLAARRERQAQEAETAEATAVDRILEKVARSGMHSLTGGEKRTLQRASENQRKRDAERAKRY